MSGWPHNIDVIDLELGCPQGRTEVGKGNDTCEICGGYNTKVYCIETDAGIIDVFFHNRLE